MTPRATALLLVSICSASAQVHYDLLLKGGHVIDPKNGISRVLDVAIAGGKIARVAPDIGPGDATRVADVAGLYVTPGLIDIHAHVYAGTGLRSLTGDSSVYPDGSGFRSGVTTMVDAGSSGWSNFPDFRQRVIDRAQTRVLALLNISGVGMAPKGENDPGDMDAAKAAKMARAHPDIIVGFKIAHYLLPDWRNVDHALDAARQTNLPLMVDFGMPSGPRNISTLLLEKLRPGDIYTHCYSNYRKEMADDGKLNPALFAARKRGVIFDLGHGGGSFYWTVAVPAFEQKFFPDSISTDLHTGSMNAGMKDMANVMSKVLSLGVPLDEVVRMSTWNPAREIKRPELGNLDVGTVADIAVLAMERGRFGFQDSAGGRRMGDRKIVAELTIRNGAV
ncbi:MAG: amidohydrolase/deacetylase family metallohydrolase, partial [Acidobacteria bacterium]|nr:amidohydrolase/deacetylase family metallohydrolase [Acidobacteriota bacterium]